MKLTRDSRADNERERILVIRFSSLGDILLTAPCVRALRSRFPDSDICLLVAQEYADAASLIPGVDRVLIFDRNTGLRGLWRLRSALSRRFSIVVDLQNSLRSVAIRLLTFPLIWVKAKRYRFKRWLFVQFKWNLYKEIKPVALRYLDAVKSLGASDDGRGLLLELPEAIHDNSGQSSPVDQPIVSLCPGARHYTKRWPIDRWVSLARELANRGFLIAVVGVSEEAGIIREVAGAAAESQMHIGKSVPEVAALMSTCVAVISNDSGLMHLAAGVSTPVVAIFGPTVEEFGFFPFRARSRVVEQDLDCRPCSAMGSERCKEGHFRCMLDTVPEMVVSALQDVLTAQTTA